jgi:hypothetical protein
MFDTWINLLTNEVRTYEWMDELHKFYIFPGIHMSNVFLMHNINVWNVWIMDEQILYDFHY